jgi:hypothetical protein
MARRPEFAALEVIVADDVEYRPKTKVEGHRYGRLAIPFRHLLAGDEHLDIFLV